VIKKGGTFRWIGHGSLDTIDPFSSTAAMSSYAGRPWLDFLLAWNLDGNAATQMLETWEISDDAIDYTFILRDGLTYHDGTAVRAHDILPSIDKWHNQIVPMPKNVWDLANPVPSVVDEKTFALKMGEPFGVFPWYASWPPIYVLPEALALKYPQSDPIPWDEAVGSGPLKLVEWLPGNVAKYERFEDYKPNPNPRSGEAGSREAYIDKMRLLEVPDGNTKMAAFETDQADFGEGIPPDFLDIARDNPQLVAVITSPDHSPGIFINKSIPPFSSVKARVALQLVINYKDAIATFGPPDMYKLGHQVFVIGGGWHTDAGIAEMFEAVENYEPTATMMARAKQLWAEAAEETGWDVSKPVEMMNATDLQHYGSLVVAKENIEDAGIPVNMPAMDWATVAGRSSTDCDWHLAITGWNSYDPISNPGFSTTWKCGWDNQEVQDLIKAFSKAGSPEEQREIVDKIQTAKINDPPYIHFGQLNGLTVHRKEVKNFQPFLTFTLDGIWLDR
jgi:peptide/nickel transport system substrate-binding protein